MKRQLTYSSRNGALIAAMLFLLSCPFAVSAWGQSTVSTGSIGGTILDQSDAVVPNAKITITNTGTSQRKELTSSSTGTYSSGPLLPGQYTVRVESQGFNAVELPVTVQVGVVAQGTVRLGISSRETITVEDSGFRVNTEQPTVQGVLTAQQIDTMPVNGRNFLDLAQLEPGVQIQDGSNFDPTKGGLAGISVGGRFGRTTLIEVDGLDISDETVGTTLSNLSQSSIQEFSIQQSTLDLSSELTSSGAVNVVTRSGTNQYHGEGFYLFRDSALSAAFPGGQKPYYQRNHYGGRFGGPVIKDKLFFFLNGERVKQDLGVPLSFDGPLAVHSGAVGEPFRDKIGFGRLDWNVSSNVRAFYRINYDQFRAVSNVLPTYAIYANVNKTPAQGAGVDFSTGLFNHSVRYGYTKFVNGITDAVTGNPGVYNPVPGVELRIGNFRSGINHLAPQSTFQTDNQIKYDGSRLYGNHIFRFGVSYNKINGGGLANFYGLGPRLSGSPSAAGVAAANAGPFPGGASNPANYLLTAIRLGNGQGFFTENPAFGLPGGGLQDNRVQWYVGDSWKIRPNMTLSAGLRYVRDTGRTNSDLPAVPCSALTPGKFTPPPPCPSSGHLLDNFGPGQGNTVRQDNNNFAPQLGITWDPWKNGKTVFRAGAGLFYDNAIFNNILFSRPNLLAKGLFNFVAIDGPPPGTGEGCQSGFVNFPNGPVTVIPSTGVSIKSLCGMPIGLAAPQVIALQHDYQAAVKAAGASANPNYIGNTLTQVDGLLDPNYRTPYSYQMNFGVQREVRPGMVLSVDYLRNVNLHFLVGVDTNHVGDSRFFNINAARNAIAATLAQCGVTSVSAGINSPCPNIFPGEKTKRSLTMEDFAANGLASGASVCGGPCSALGLDPDHGAAFPGINPLVGQNVVLSPVGRSVYNALEVALRNNFNSPLPYVKHLSMQVSYTLSRYTAGVGASGDADFVGTGNDYRDPNRFAGPASFDRTSQFAIGTTFELPKAVRLSLISHLNSPLASSMFIDGASAGNIGEIFHTDFTGDGTTSDPLPGTRTGSFGRDIKAADLNKFLTNYNTTVAGKPTPAGQVLVNNGLFTAGQLQALGGVADSVPLAPADPASNGWLKTFDLKLAAPIKVTERVSIEPAFSAYNLFNFANFDISPVTRLGTAGVFVDALDGAPGTVNGTSKHDNRNSERAGQSSSTFSLGSPRQLEFGLRITF